MYPFSITFHTADHLVFKIISILLGLFIVVIWAYNSSHIKLILRLIIGLLGGIAGYYIAIFFFGILELSYTTIKDDFSSNKQSLQSLDMRNLSAQAIPEIEEILVR